MNKVDDPPSSRPHEENQQSNSARIPRNLVYVLDILTLPCVKSLNVEIKKLASFTHPYVVYDDVREYLRDPTSIDDRIDGGPLYNLLRNELCFHYRKYMVHNADVENGMSVWESIVDGTVMDVYH